MTTKATDSVQVERARKKLQKQMILEQKQVTAAALSEVGGCISRWITRHADDRVSLKKKTVTLFNGNKTPAKTQNKYILKLLHKLKTQFAKTESLTPFKGRIKF